MTLIEEHKTAAYITVSFIYWNLINLVAMYVKLDIGFLSKEDQLDFRNRLVSIVHGIMAIVFGGYQQYFVHESCGSPNNFFEDFVVANTCGYFLYDLVVMAYFGLLDKTMFVHHWICIFGFGMSLWIGISSHYTICGLFIADLRTPLHHRRRGVAVVFQSSDPELSP